MAANTNQNSAFPMEVDDAVLSAAGIRAAPAPAPAPAPAATAAGKSGKSRKSADSGKSGKSGKGVQKPKASDSAGIQAMINAAVRAAERETRARVESEMLAKAREAQRAAVERAQIDVLKGQLAEANDEIAKYKSLVVRLAKADQSGNVEATKAAIFGRHERLFGAEEDPECADYEHDRAETSTLKRLRDSNEERAAVDDIPAHDKSQDEEEEEEPAKKKRVRDPAAPRVFLKAAKMWVSENMQKVYTGQNQENKEDPVLKADFIEKMNWNQRYAPNKETINEDGSVIAASPGCMALLGAYYKQHLTDEERAPYEKREAEDKERYDREMKAYKAQKAK